MASTSLLYRFSGNLSREIPKSLFLIICPETGAENRGIFRQKRACNPPAAALLAKMTKEAENYLLTNRRKSCILYPNSKTMKRDDREKVLFRMLQRAAGCCEAARRGRMSLALERFR